MSRLRRTFASLAIRPYRRFVVGNLTSLLGFWIRITAQGWLVWTLTESEAMLGMVTLVGLLPFTVLSPFGGVLADRVDRRRVLMLLPLVSVVSNLVLAALILSGSVTVGHVILVAVAIGSTRAVEIPVRNAFVRDLVGMKDLGNAIALNAATFNMARVMGPALGALLLWQLGIGPCFLVAAVGNLSMTFALWRLDVPPAFTPTRGTRAGQQLKEGFAYVRGHRRTRTLLLLLAVALLFTWSYQAIMPAYAAERFDMGKEGYALLLSVVGAGALCGALWVAGRPGPRRGRRGIVFALLWGGAACVFTLGFAEHLAVALPALFVTGFCQVGFIATANGMVQESVPDALRGRVMGIWAFTFGTFFPIGGQLMGVVSEVASIRVAWSGGAVLMVLGTLWVRLRMPPRAPAAPPLAENEARAAEGQSPGVADPAA